MWGCQKGGRGLADAAIQAEYGFAALDFYYRVRDPARCANGRVLSTGLRPVTFL